MFSPETARQCARCSSGDAGRRHRAWAQTISFGRRQDRHGLQAGGQGPPQKKYRAWFVGMAPATNPRIVVAVMVDEPSNGKYYGGDVAAPVFAQVVQQTLRTMSRRAAGPRSACRRSLPARCAPRRRSEVLAHPSVDAAVAWLRAQGAKAWRRTAASVRPGDAFPRLARGDARCAAMCAPQALSAGAAATLSSRPTASALRPRRRRRLPPARPRGRAGPLASVPSTSRRAASSWR